MHHLRTIVAAFLAVLLAMPAGAASSLGVFCIEIDGSVSVKASGCGCLYKHDGHALSEESDFTLDSGRVEDEHCKPCVDFPLSVGLDELAARAHRIDTTAFKVSLPASTATTSLARYETSLRDTSGSTLEIFRPAGTGTIPLRI